MPTSTPPRNCPASARNRRGRLMLGVCCGAILIVWLVVLPWWASRPAMRAHLEWLDAKGVDPSAMYYTELEMMKPILQRLNRPERAADAASDR